MHGKRFYAYLQNLCEEYYCEPQIQQILYNSFFVYRKLQHGDIMDFWSYVYEEM